MIKGNWACLHVDDRGGSVIRGWFGVLTKTTLTKEAECNNPAKSGSYVKNM